MKVNCRDRWYNKLATLATAHAPVGPVAEQLSAIAARLGTIGIRLIEIRRGFDARAWPYTSRGFFGLKEKIPKLLDALGIVDDKCDPALRRARPVQDGGG